jgi:hypothetical protein
MPQLSSCGYKHFFESYASHVRVVLVYGVTTWGAKYLLSNPVFHGHMKHIEVNYHFV